MLSEVFSLNNMLLCPRLTGTTQTNTWMLSERLLLHIWMLFCPRCVNASALTTVSSVWESSRT